MNEEMWKDIPGYEGYYQVSRMGNVRSLHGNHDKKYHNRYLKHSIRGTIRNVTLSKDNKTKTFTIPKLVMLAFVGEPNGRIIWHIDRDTTNDRLSNLQYITKSEMCKLIGSERNLVGLRYSGSMPCAFIKADGTRTEYDSFKSLYTAEGMSRYYARLIAKGTPPELHKGCKIEFL